MTVQVGSLSSRLVAGSSADSVGKPETKTGPKGHVDRLVLRTLSPLTTGLAVVFALLIAFHLFEDLPSRSVLPLIISDAMAVVALVMLRVALHTNRIAPRFANSAALGVTILAVFEVLLAFYLTRDPFYFAYLSIILVGCGSIFFSLRWLVAAIIGVLGAWLSVAWTAVPQPGQLIHYGLPVFVGAVLAVIVCLARRRTILRLAADLRSAHEEATWRMKEEEHLRLLTRAVEQSPGLVIITDTEGQIEYVNPRFSQVTGYSAEEVVGKNPRFLKSGEIPQETYDELWRTISAGEVWQGELKNKKKNQESYWVISSVSPIKNLSGVIEHFLAVQEDVTRHREIERHFGQIERLRSVGQLVSGIAHDFNNLMTAVLGFCELGLEKVSERDPLHENLSEIKKAGESASSLTRQLLAFSRQQRLEPKVIELNDTIAAIEPLLRRSINEDIDLVLSLEPDLWRIRIDPVGLEQILVNLAVNARDAMPTGGQLTIETTNCELDPNYTKEHLVPEAGPFVMMAVSDTGRGMNEEIRRRIFEPFFTTKERGEGTGLGLSTVYGLVKQSGGFIWTYSEPGRGTTFKIYLPRAAGPAEPEAVGRAKPTSLNGTETILVVEDDKRVRSLLSAALGDRGYHVITAAEPSVALKVFDENKIDLLLTDMVMPGMNGSVLAERLVSRQPELRVILMSGYTEKGLLQTMSLGPDTPFLEKPVKIETLLQTVRSIFGGASTAAPVSSKG